jgi:hypothetical protein
VAYSKHKLAPEGQGHDHAAVHDKRVLHYLILITHLNFELNFNLNIFYVEKKHLLKKKNNL